MNSLIVNILTIGGIGCLVFTAFILFMAYSGIASEMRDEEGNFKKNRNLKTVLGGTLFIFFLIGILYVGNLYLMESAEESPGLFQLWINSFGIFFLIHLYDLVILDYFVVIKWHPKFLNLPDTHYYKSFRPHLHGFIKGIPIGVGASFIASVLTLVIN
ncbi:MAG: hypothetical protein HC811_05945 [Flammeovirgaceae bacterium]|nr:hypothetical protein [Flammeovirgaceae bacterium]